MILVNSTLFVMQKLVSKTNDICLKFPKSKFLNKIYNINSEQLIDKKWLDLFDCQILMGKCIC